jgi:pimeloyl-ACP methyl ester carboxylesterase
MGRGWKIGIGIVAVLAVLLGVNTLVTDGETEKAEVTVPGGRLMDLPGGEIQVVEGGPRNGSPIVLVHCFTCAIDWWDRVRPALERRHRVIAVDLLGHGGSEKPDTGYTPPNQAKVIGQALRRLGVAKAEIVGHSLGGSVVVALAQQVPELVDRVVIIDTAPDHSRSSLGFIPGLAFAPVIGEALWQIKPDFAVRDGLGVAFAPGFDVPDAFVDDVNRMTFTAYDDSPTGSEDFADEEPLDERMRETALPLMVLMGAEEQIIDGPAGALAEYRRTVPWVQTHLIAGAGHSPAVEKPAQTAGLLLAFANAPRKALLSGTERASGVRGAAGNR